MVVYEVDNTREIWTTDPIPKNPPSKWWHLWFQPLNLAAFAFGICVLTGCRTPSSVTYKLYSVNGANITQAMSRNCTSCNLNNVPEQYVFGMSGVCRVINDTTECQTGFTSLFNISTVVLADINPSWISTNASISPDEQHVEFPSATSINHAQVRQLASAVGAIVIISVLISFSAVPLTIWKGPLNRYIFPFLVYDSLALFAAVIMFYSIFRQEVAGAYSPVEIPNEVAFGYGAWFLVAVFLCRLVSNPALIPYFLATVLTGGLFLLLTLWLMLLPKGRPRPRFLGYVTTPLQQ